MPSPSASPERTASRALLKRWLRRRRKSTSGAAAVEKMIAIPNRLKSKTCQRLTARIPAARTPTPPPNKPTAEEPRRDDREQADARRRDPHAERPLRKHLHEGLEDVERESGHLRGLGDEDRPVRGLLENPLDDPRVLRLVEPDSVGQAPELVQPEHRRDGQDDEKAADLPSAHALVCVGRRAPKKEERAAESEKREEEEDPPGPRDALARRKRPQRGGEKHDREERSGGGAEERLPAGEPRLLPLRGAGRQGEAHAGGHEGAGEPDEEDEGLRREAPGTRRREADDHRERGDESRTAKKGAALCVTGLRHGSKNSSRSRDYPRYRRVGAGSARSGAVAQPRSRGLS